MGGYVAGIQHLGMLQLSFGKSEHGLRESNIDHKDKQKFNAVLNIIRASPLFQQIADAKATKQYVDIIGCVVAYLNREVTPLERIKEYGMLYFFFVTGVSG